MIVPVRNLYPCLSVYVGVHRKSYQILSLTRLILFLVLVTFAAIRPALNASDALGLAVLHGGLCGRVV